jgi:AAHS family 4-hydroxybenzoate transporter-like MFS transporter
MFYAASGLFLVATIFSTVLAVLYRARFGEEHGKDNSAIKMRSALGDS